MRSRRYGVLRGLLKEGRRGRHADRPHYHLILQDDLGRRFNVAQNVQSADGSMVVYTVVRPFDQPGLTDRLLTLRSGFTPLQTEPGGLALDYLRGNYFPFERSSLKSLLFHKDGPRNDLQDEIQFLSSLGDGPVEIFAFGGYFRIGHGLHEVHMNQGNMEGGRWFHQNGVWQDGALLFYYPEIRQLAALFTMFQTQHLPTDAAGAPATGSRSLEELLALPSA